MKRALLACNAGRDFLLLFSFRSRQEVKVRVDISSMDLPYVYAASTLYLRGFLRLQYTSAVLLTVRLAIPVISHLHFFDDILIVIGKITVETVIKKKG
jgi:hypothetical protein